MKCSEVQELLSAYFDNELSKSTRATVRAHIDECSACQTELAQFEGLSSLTGGLARPTMPASTWAEIAKGLSSNLDGEPLAESRVESTLRKPQRSDIPNTLHSSRRRIFQYAAALAATLVLGFVGMEFWTHDHHDHDHTEMAKAMEQVAGEINSDEATHLLLKKYVGSEVSYQNAFTQVGYQPIASKGLPAGYSVEGVQVLDMPCCKCTQTACRRPDSSRFFIFEHSNEEPGWFEHRKKRQCECAGNRCEIVELDNQLVATWKKGDRHITLLGVRDEEEIELLAKHFDKSS